VHGATVGSGRLAAAWLTGTALAVLALSHVPVATSWTDPATATVSGADAVALPAAQRLQPVDAEVEPSAGAVLPPTPGLPLLPGLAAAALVGLARRPWSGSRPGPARGPPGPLR
jgi:hypothetical protein